MYMQVVGNYPLRARKHSLPGRGKLIVIESKFAYSNWFTPLSTVILQRQQSVEKKARFVPRRRFKVNFDF